jgi:hypothetical protein
MLAHEFCLLIYSTDHSSQAERDPEEEGDYMAFEQLMAEAMQKKGKDEKKKKKSKHSHDSPETAHPEEKASA